MPKDISNLLRETKIGQKGFVREDVLNYIDELQTKNEDLEKELAEIQGSGNTSSNDVKQLEAIIKTLEGKLKMSDTALANERQSRDRERQQYEDRLRKASSNGGYNPENEKLLKEKDELLAKKDEELILMQDKVQQVKDFLVEKEETMNSLNDTIDKLKNENEELSKSIANDDSKKVIEELNNDKAELNKQIDKLKSKVEEMSQIDESKLAMTYMASLIENAKNTAEQLVNDATAKADTILADAEKIKSEATEQADKTIIEANEKANQIVEDAKISANEKIIAINEKSENIENDAKSFKDIVMSQISNISESLTNVIELINSANDTISQTGERISNDEQLSELISNLPKEEVSYVVVKEKENVPSVETIDTPQPVEVQEDVKEDIPAEKKIVDIDNLDDLNDFILPPKNVNNDTITTEEPTSKVSEFNIDGLDDLLKAVEETADDEEFIQEIPEEPKNKGDFSMEGLEDLLKEVEATTPDDMEEI